MSDQPVARSSDRQHRVARHQRSSARAWTARDRRGGKRRDRRRRGRTRRDRRCDRRRPDRCGRGCVLPGFVDSHTHLVFAGDRAEEFATRMAGRPVRRWWDPGTTEATRSTPTAELDAGAPTAARGASGRTTTIEIKSGYGLNVVDEASSVRSPARHERIDIPRRPPGTGRVRGTCRRLHPAGVHRHARRSSAEREVGRHVLRDAEPSTPISAGRCSTRDVPRVSACGCTGTSSDTARACSSPWSAAARRSTTAHT